MWDLKSFKSLFCFSLLGSESSVDLVFLVDTSNSTTNEQLKNILELIKTQTSSYSIGNKAKIALVAYGSEPSTILNFDDVKSFGDVVKGLYRVSLTGGVGDLPKALNHVNQEVIPRARRDKPTIVTIFTTKNPDFTQQKDLKAAKDRLHNRLVKIMVTSLDESGMTKPLSDLSNVVDGSLVPQNPDDLTDLLPKVIDAVKRAQGTIVQKLNKMHWPSP